MLSNHPSGNSSLRIQCASCPSKEGRDSIQEECLNGTPACEQQPEDDLIRGTVSYGIGMPPPPIDPCPLLLNTLPRSAPQKGGGPAAIGSEIHIGSRGYPATRVVYSSQFPIAQLVETGSRVHQHDVQIRSTSLSRASKNRMYSSH